MATRTSRYVQISVGTTNCLCFTTKLNMPYLKQGHFRLIFASWKKPLWNLSKIYLSVSIWQQISTNSNVIEQDNKTFYKTFYFQYCWSETLTAFSLALKKCGWLLWFNGQLPTSLPGSEVGRLHNKFQPLFLDRSL